jgi:pimeloyl-ACP methyl ester carboxylesterase
MGATNRVRACRVLSALCLAACADQGEPALGTVQAGAAASPTASMSAAVTKIDRSALIDVGTGKDLDYGDPRLWLCRPGNDPDECDRNLDATELLPDGTRVVVPHVKAKDPAFDCFYVYPTVKLTSAGPMTDFANIAITLDPLLAQGARFSRICKVYAPLYRQNGVVPGAGGAPMVGGSFDLGQNDVRAAFKYYLEHLSQGRKFVLIGHSQGTGMLTGMIAQDIDQNPAVRERLISALLVGGGVTVPAGTTVGGSFKNVPLCTQPKQAGCVIAYNSFSQETPPGATSTFARSSMPGMQVACTEPAALAGRSGQLYQGSYVALHRVNAGFVQDGFDKLPPDIQTPFIVYRNVFRGECKASDGASYLQISLQTPAGDMRPPPPYHSAAIETALGLHLVDYNLELDDLIDTVRQQAETAGR